MDKAIQVSAYIPQTLLEKLEAVAKVDRRSLSQVVALAVEQFIGKPEQVVKWRQVDIADAIAATVKPSRPAKHK
jgi:metal-responsive CopG/Arc/MetJ family transcriptional regulator